MQRLQAFRFRLEPNGEQQRQMRRFAGSSRFVFNKALALQKQRYENGEKKLGYGALCKLLVSWKCETETTWLAETHSQVLQQSLKDLERAYQNFFAKRTEFPRFKKRGMRDSFRFPQGCKLDEPNNRVFIPKIGWLKYRNSQRVLGTIKNITLSLHGGHWFASLQTAREVDKPRHASKTIVGVDLGVVRLATLSDGTQIAPVNSLRKHAAALAHAQRDMSRKQKFSSNWRKAKCKVQRIHVRIANVRRDMLHKSTTAISKNHAVVCIEDLQVKNMSASAKGNKEKPGRNVRAKSGLNKAILDQGWSEFRRQLQYKQDWRGGMLVVVSPAYTSQTCPQCGTIDKDNRPTQSEFICVKCSYRDHADKVGALNILRAGHAQLACQASDEVVSPATGTHRSYLGRNGLKAVGITAL